MNDTRREMIQCQRPNMTVPMRPTYNEPTRHYSDTCPLALTSTDLTHEPMEMDEDVAMPNLIDRWERSKRIPRSVIRNEQRRSNETYVIPQNRSSMSPKLVSTLPKDGPLSASRKESSTGLKFHSAPLFASPVPEIVKEEDHFISLAWLDELERQLEPVVLSPDTSSPIAVSVQSHLCDAMSSLSEGALETERGICEFLFKIYTRVMSVASTHSVQLLEMFQLCDTVVFHSTAIPSRYKRSMATSLRSRVVAILLKEDQPIELVKQLKKCAKLMWVKRLMKCRVSPIEHPMLNKIVQLDLLPHDKKMGSEDALLSVMIRLMTVLPVCSFGSLPVAAQLLAQVADVFEQYHEDQLSTWTTEFEGINLLCSSSTRKLLTGLGYHLHETTSSQILIVFLRELVTLLFQTVLPTVKETRWCQPSSELRMLTQDQVVLFTPLILQLDQIIEQRSASQMIEDLWLLTDQYSRSRCNDNSSQHEGSFTLAVSIIDEVLVNTIHILLKVMTNTIDLVPMATLRHSLSSLETLLLFNALNVRPNHQRHCQLCGNHGPRKETFDEFDHWLPILDFVRNDHSSEESDSIVKMIHEHCWHRNLLCHLGHYVGKAKSTASRCYANRPHSQLYEHCLGEHLKTELKVIVEEYFMKLSTNHANRSNSNTNELDVLHQWTTAIVQNTDMRGTWKYLNEACQNYHNSMLEQSVNEVMNLDIKFDAIPLTRLFFLHHNHMASSAYLFEAALRHYGFDSLSTRDFVFSSLTEGTSADLLANPLTMNDHSFLSFIDIPVAVRSLAIVQKYLIQSSHHSSTNSADMDASSPSSTEVSFSQYLHHTCQLLRGSMESDKNRCHRQVNKKPEPSNTKMNNPYESPTPAPLRLNNNDLYDALPEAWEESSEGSIARDTTFRDIASKDLLSTSIKSWINGLVPPTTIWPEVLKINPELMSDTGVIRHLMRTGFNDDRRSDDVGILWHYLLRLIAPLKTANDPIIGVQTWMENSFIALVNEDVETKSVVHSIWMFYNTIWDHGIVDTHQRKVWESKGYGCCLGFMSLCPLLVDLFIAGEEHSDDALRICAMSLSDLLRHCVYVQDHLESTSVRTYAIVVQVVEVVEWLYEWTIIRMDMKNSMEEEV